MTNWRVVDIIKTSTDFLEKKGVPDARLDAEILLGNVLKKNRLELYLFFDRPMGKDEMDLYREHIRRRGTREPLQHIVGETGFMNLVLKTTSAALIPRQETEILIEKTLELNIKPGARILDIGTGSGCIAIALAQSLKEAKLLGIDVSKEALALAKENATLSETQVVFQEIDILTSLPNTEERFDIVVSNPPYIAPDEKDQLQAEVLQFDPEVALFDESDGLSFYRRFAEILPDLLIPGGHFLFEFGGSPQEKPVLNIFMEKGFHDLEIIQDYNGDPRIISGKYIP
ncbi:MAG: peptide chain release factor N(5)-glutamine methyltransferase [Candidatus Marinimicrobia bacterium]|jgi:release factor glutamine methyltransferase|nr:peptide chain release factor N(5)-glutamine methyltransferase [Candidatus Neomarinimicrobiota bacterium]MBT3631031.1 peptide chain release factor N(5)-glutamine methyltransferase [Candidatus Neomarinimicrobiota bacterium]MBT3825671.1 peptide chain release factor N(5)-glutamine methyltransferase [Candidatus Neomarinimicrobiota bacterium]MBT4130585.1 peptide chain release factor N(5)-glutamine methyltransferase [Candidatus Neomarinimicrobiota bacterium]MBT4296194.1 peptide chain release factor